MVKPIAELNSPGILLAAKWLRKKFRIEAITQLFFGLVFGVMAAVVLGLMAVAAGLILYALVAEAGTLFPALQYQHGTNWPLFWFLLAGVMLLSFVGAYSNRNGLDYSGVGYGKGSLFNANLGAAIGKMGFELLYAGPQLGFVFWDNCWGAVRLLHADIPHLAVIVLWLAERGHKASAEEIAKEFPMINVVSVLPQLRDLPGVIWLIPRSGVILLSEELRKELRQLLGKYWSTPKAQTYTRESSETYIEPPSTVNAEVLLWYETLGLPAFAPIQVVKKRYRQLAKQHHPDMVANKGKFAEKISGEKMKRINLAYEAIIQNAAKGPVVS